VHLTPKGLGYSATLEQFVSGKLLPLTDAVIGKDGAMYFATGGRRVQSGLYRVTYRGAESTALSATPAETTEHRLRVELERLHEEGTGPEVIDKAWPHLGHADRLVRHAARVAVEHVGESFDGSVLEAGQEGGGGRGRSQCGQACIISKSRCWQAWMALGGREECGASSAVLRLSQGASSRSAR
jgi:hypothetical protein